MLRWLIVVISMSTALCGCSISARSVYSGTGQTFDLREEGVQVLGEVTACQGGFCENDETGRTEWPMSLTVPPPAATYHAAIRAKAARTFHVPEEEIVVGEVKVGYYTEIVGTIRGWTATAPVGRRVVVTRSDRSDAGPAKLETVPERLRLLDNLRQQGLISEAEYKTKRDKLLNDSLGP